MAPFDEVIQRFWEPGQVPGETYGGHQFLALDYRESGPDGEPAVLWTDTELVSTFELAPTFRAFVERLRPIASIPGALPTPEELDAVTRRPWPVRLLRRLRR